MTKRDPAFGYALLLALFVAAYTIAPLQSYKVAELGGLVFPAGDLIYAFTFIATDIVNEIFGRKHAKRIVYCGLLALVCVMLFNQIAVLLPNASFWNGAAEYDVFFSSSLRISLATLAAYIISQFTDIYIFSLIRKKTSSKFLFIRNNLSTFCARFLDVTTWTMIAFWGVYGTDEIWSIISGAFIAGVIISLIDTPIVYLGVYTFHKIYPQIKRETQTREES